MAVVALVIFSIAVFNNFRKTSQYGSRFASVSFASVSFAFQKNQLVWQMPFESNISILINHFRKTSQYGSCIFSTYSLIACQLFQKNQLVWQFFPLNKFQGLFERIFQKNQLVWQQHLSDLHLQDLRLISEKLVSMAVKSLQFHRQLYTVFQKNQLVWQPCNQTNCFIPLLKYFRKTSQYGSQSFQSLHDNFHLLYFRKTSQYGSFSNSPEVFMIQIHFRKTSQYGRRII